VAEQALAVTVGPDDSRYADLVGRGSRRFAGKPDYVRPVSSTEQVVDAVQDAVRDRLRVAVRSGGHCLENFVADPAVRVVIDTSLMTAVSYDSEMDAFAIEPACGWARRTGGCFWAGA
jgi:FAD/FMN-containing dehydrogenase